MITDASQQWNRQLVGEFVNGATPHASSGPKNRMDMQIS
jgi:hypothetical protein